MSMPRISIIIPTLNQGQYIESAIRSVLHQKYDNLQLIIIDGGSTDVTNEVILKYKNNISHYISEKDSGQTEAINKGIKLADGDIVTWLNSDDFYEAGAFDTVVPYFGEAGTGIVYGKARVFGETRRTETIGAVKDLPLHEYLSYMRIPQPAMFFKGEAIRSVGPLNQDLHYTMDFELTAKVVLAGYKIKRIDKLIANYRFHENSKSNLNHRFLHEWTKEVHDILSCFPAGHFLAVEMELLFKLSPKPNTFYKPGIGLNKEELTDIFLVHMDLHFHYAYRERDRSEMERIARYLKRKFPAYYAQNKYDRYLNRIKIVPSFILKLLRKFTR
jgi:glycosyltransferase involved in cell wall biosynthesis